MTFDNLTNYSPCLMSPYSLSHVSSDIKLRFSLTVTIVIYLIYLLPFCFGVFGNISVCLIFFQQKKLRSITNIFLMNLCINDLIVLCVSIPMTITSVLIEHFVFGSFLCKLINFTPTVTALVSTFTVAVISVERWFVIVNKKKFNRKCIIITLILLWLGSILIAIPEYLSRTVIEFSPSDITKFDSLHIMMIKNYTYDQQQQQQQLQQNNNQTMIMIQKPCKTLKIYYCITKPGLKTRVYTYTILAVQYLVPFLFVSISCYSISRFLKRRIERMKYYNQRKKIDQKSLTKRFNYKTNESTKIYSHNHHSDIDNELTSNDELPKIITTDNNLIKEKEICEIETVSHSSIFTRLRYILSQKHRSHNKKYSLHYTNPQSTVLIEETIRPSSTNIYNNHPKIQSHTKRRFHKSRKLLICVAAVFMLSWLPLSIVQFYLEHNDNILKTRDGANFVYRVLLIPSYLITSLSAWINPVIYNYINRSFRREFYALYSCCFKNQRDINNSRITTTMAMSTYNTSQHQTSLLLSKKDGKYLTSTTIPIPTPTLTTENMKPIRTRVTFVDNKKLIEDSQTCQL
ncbi:unnamed protein product [Didymodactylos carnosus]|uniref:G-protein coupled receptors family 1 profile domain-containing protein n=1 Tax=Didymodactylos carnosus TaxID=1234261 RepID=A0A814J5X2_9BILA|nr:unnamed protein product [Didymodactylos carnosus]CAF3803788.1 unnamed protein product [Didymodactylos carnosus]